MLLGKVESETGGKSIRTVGLWGYPKELDQVRNHCCSGEHSLHLLSMSRPVLIHILHPLPWSQTK